MYEVLFGELARALEPRALVGRAPHPAWAPGRVLWGTPHVRLALRVSALSEPMRELLGDRRVGGALTNGKYGYEDFLAGWRELRCEPVELMKLMKLEAHEHAVRILLATWKAANQPVAPPRVMGVVNATPDSFSDGGRYLDPQRAIEHGLRLAEEGADLLDVGGESTRPGSDGVSAEVELERVVPVIAGLRAGCATPIAVDTTKSVVAAAALDAGAAVVNDVSAGRFDPEMLPLVAARGCDYVAMHMRGRPRDMQEHASYADPVRAVLAELRERVAACLNAGIALPRITLDPGIGFAKGLADNLELIRRLPELRSLGRPLCLGVSRKSFLGRITGVSDPLQRRASTLAAVTACALAGAEWLRVHEVAPAKEALRVAAALAGHEPSDPPDAEAGA